MTACLVRVISLQSDYVFFQGSADKHAIKNSLAVSSVPWITSALRRNIRRKNITKTKATWKTHAGHTLDPNFKVKGEKERNLS